MARKRMIPDEIREQVGAKVDAFNRVNIQPTEPSAMIRLLSRLGMLPPTNDAAPEGSYVARFRGAFLYLDRIGFRGRPFEVCRLKWTGDIENWEFAIYRHSRNFYDAKEWFFPGAEEVDGTVEGAMRAGLKAYPL
jgi:hypothetical protein